MKGSGLEPVERILRKLVVSVVAHVRGPDNEQPETYSTSTEADRTCPLRGVDTDGRLHEVRHLPETRNKVPIALSGGANEDLASERVNERKKL